MGWAPVTVVSRRSGLSPWDLLVLASVAGTLLLVDLSAPALPGGGAFLLLLLPVLLCAATLGVSRGLAALLLGATGALVLVPLRGHPWLVDALDLARLVLYLAVGTGIALAAGAIPAAADPRASGEPAASSGVAATGGLVEPLTRREVEVLRLAAQGRSVDEIGRQLYLSRNTVKSHLAHAYGKLGARNRAQAVALSIHAGVLDPEALGELH